MQRKRVLSDRDLKEQRKDNENEGQTLPVKPICAFDVRQWIFAEKS